MLLIDGVKYELWTPSNEDEFEGVVKEHAQDIFGEHSIYLGRKQKLKSLSGIGSIPDGYVITLGSAPQWHIVEVELSSHPLHDHIVSQVSRFITGISNPNMQRQIAEAIYQEITRDNFLKLKVEQAIQSTEIYKALLDLVSKQPILIIIIEKDTEELREALSTLRYPQIKVVELQTFTREEVGLLVHAHLFQPVFQVPTGLSPIVGPEDEVDRTRKDLGRVTVKNLIDNNILKVGQEIYRWYKGNKYIAIVLHDGKVKLIRDNSEHNSLSTAAKRIAGSVDGWEWWHTIGENGRECKLDELRNEYRVSHLSKS